MSTFTVETLSTLSADELDKLGLDGETVLIKEFLNSKKDNLPPLKGGWECRYVGPSQDPDSVGKIVLVPKTPWTRDLWNAGQLKTAMAAGLTKTQAERWHTAVCRNKHDFLDLLNDVLNRPLREILSANQNLMTRVDLIQGYLDYDIGFTREQYQRWVSRTQIRYPRHPVRLSDFGKLLRAVIGTDSFQEKPTIGSTVKEESKDSRPWEV